MSSSVFIAGDWGSTNLRLYLCRYTATEPLDVLATKTGPGVRPIHQRLGDFEQIFFDLAADWLEEHGSLRVLLSGAVGSTIGWRGAPYLECPVGPEQIMAGTTAFEARGLAFLMVAGLKAQSALGAPDVMRGEELQLLGWMRSQDYLKTGTEQQSGQIVVLPGTHNKWALVKNGQVETFVTAFTGELYSILESHSILITQSQQATFSTDWFMRGVEVVRYLQPGQLLHALFTARSLQVEGELPPEDARSYLSGLLVGADIVGSIELFNKQVAELPEVVLIGDPELSHAYQLALKAMGIESRLCNATDIAIAGYQAIYEFLNTDKPL